MVFPGLFRIKQMVCILSLCLIPAWLTAEKHWVIPFGTAEPQPDSLHGRIYSLPQGTRALPDFENLQPRGDLYAWSLTVNTRNSFAWRGLPGSEWYAIDYRGTVFVSASERLVFSLLSDDGSKLYIDDRCIIDNDGIHSSQTKRGHVRLAKGFHTIRISYFQGPAPYVALVLSVKLPGQELRPFDLRDFASPDEDPVPGLRERQR